MAWFDRDWHEFLEAATAGIASPVEACRVREELLRHMEALRDELADQGWAPDEAAAEAVRRMGDPASVRRLWLVRVADARPLVAALAAGALALQVGALWARTLLPLSWIGDGLR